MLHPAAFLLALTPLADALRPAQEPASTEEHGASVVIARDTPGPDTPELADAHFAGAQALNQEGAYREAFERIESCVKIRESLPDGELDLARALEMRATIGLSLGGLAAAEADMRRVLQIREDALGPEHEDAFRTKDNLAAVLVSKGDMYGALPMLEEVVGRLEEMYGPTSHEVTDSLGKLAYVLSRVRRPDEAREAFERVLEVEQQVYGERSVEVANTRSNLAFTLYELGDSSGERRELELALDIVEDVLGPDHPRTLIYLRLLGDALFLAGNSIEALPKHERARKGLEQALGPASPETIYAGEGCVKALRALGRLEEALEMAEWVHEQYALAFGEDHLYTIDGQTSIGLCLWLLGRGEEAIPYYEDALDRTETLYGRRAVTGDSLNGLAQLYQTVGRLEEALEMREQAIEIARSRGAQPRMISAFVGSLGSLHLLMGNDREAWEQLRFAIRKDFELRDGYALTAVEWEGSLSAATKDWYIEMGMSIARRIDDAELHAEVFEALLAWKGRVGRRVAGLRAALRADIGEEQGQALEALRSVQSALSIGVHDRASRADLDGLLQERSKLERGLLASAGAGSASIDTTVAEIQALLPPRTAALDFFIHDDYTRFENRHEQSSRGFGMQPKRITAWVLAQSGAPRPIDLGDMATIEGAVADYLDAIAASRLPTRGLALSQAPRGDMLGPGRRLRALLWDPLVPYLQDTDRVIVCADRFLGGLPLEILPTDDGDFLVEQYAFIYQPSLAALPAVLSAQRVTSNARGLLSVGGVEYGAGTAWTALAATGPEAAQVAETARSILDAPVTELVGEDAEASHFVEQLVGRRWVHVATHGFFAPSSDPRHERLTQLMPGLFTGLVFAGANQSAAGLLTAEQVSWLDLSACELVVLSACSTGMGERRAADELVSLQRAFRLAGARAIVSSLWNVDDASTGELMTAFYTNLWELELPKHEALRQAQLSLLRQDRKLGISAPSRWGAFVMSGDWR